MDAIFEQLAEILEVDKVAETDVLKSFESFDSLTILSIIALADEHGVTLSNQQVREFATVGDLARYIKAQQDA